MVWSGDPALDKSDGWEDRVEQARDGMVTWESVCSPGAVPTIFVMRRLPGSLRRRLVPLIRGTVSGSLDDAALMFRISLSEVKNGGPIKVEFGTHPELGCRTATEALVDTLDKIDPDIVTELGIQAFKRWNASPKA